MSQTVSQYPGRISIQYGALAGFIAGIVMMGVAIATTVAIGMPYDTIPKAVGVAFGFEPDYLVIAGIGMHLYTSTVIGFFFGLVTSAFPRFHITSLRKGILMGIGTAMIAFAAISLPLSTLVLPPIIAKIMANMAPGMTPEMALVAMMSKKALVISSPLARHLAYGAILGMITAVFVIRKIYARA